MEKIKWKVDGMDCNNCALTIRKSLEKQGGKDVRVNFATGDVIFDLPEVDKKEKLSKGIDDLGYKIVGPGDHSQANGHGHEHEEEVKGAIFASHLQRFWFC